MKSLLSLSIVILVFNINTFPQTACDNHKKMQAVPATTKNSLAKFARTYWAKRCACESGAITGGTWDYSVEIMNRMYDNYQDPNFLKDYDGDPFPIPDKRMKVSDCKNDNNLYLERDYSDCLDNKFDASTDPQQFGNAFLLAKCECEKGVATQERARELEATMKVNYQNCKTYYGNTLGLSTPLSWEDCPILQFGGTTTMSSNTSSGSIQKDKWSYYEDDLINNDARNIIGELAANSDNEALKQLSQDLNNLSQPNQQLANYREFFNITPTQADMEFEQVMTNVAQGVAVAKFAVNWFKQKKAERDQQLAWEKKQGEAAVWRIRNNLEAMHEEIAEIPNYNNYGLETLIAIDSLQKRYYAYDIATAPERKFLINYFYGQYWYSVEQIQSEVQELSNRNPVDLLREIDQWQSNNSEFHNRTDWDTPHTNIIFANSDYSLRSNKVILNIYKMLSYKKLGRNKEAEQIRNELDYDLAQNQIFQHMKKAVYKNDVTQIEHLMPLLKAYLEILRLDNKSVNTEEHQRLMDKIFTKETLLLYANGIQKSIQQGRLNSAEKEILFLKAGLEHLYLKKELNHRDLDKISIIETLEAMLLINKGKHTEGLSKVNAAIARSDDYNTEFWKKWIKFNALVAIMEYENAHRTYNEIIDRYSYKHHGDDFLFDIYELKYAKCELLFQQQEYDRVLKGLMMLEAAKPDVKYNLLRYKVYKAKGDIQKANDELLKIKN